MCRAHNLLHIPSTCSRPGSHWQHSGGDIYPVLHVVHPLLPITAQLLLQNAAIIVTKLLCSCNGSLNLNTHVCTLQMQSYKRCELHFYLCHTHSSLVQERLLHRFHQGLSWHYTLYRVQIISLITQWMLNYCMQDHNNHEYKIGLRRPCVSWYVALTAHSIDFSFTRLTLTALGCTSEAGMTS